MFAMPPPDSSRILATLCAYWQTEALKAAIDLGVFTVLGGAACTPSELARGCGANEAALRRLCDYLVFLGLLRTRHGRYRSAADVARFLDARSPHALTTVSRFFNAPPVTAAFARLADIVRGDKRVNAIEQDGEGSLWQEFARSTLPLRQLHAKELASVLRRRQVVRGRILDLGAGGSPLGIELIRRSRGTSLVVQDRPAVLEIALEHAAAAGVAPRVSALPGDARSVDFGGPFHLVLMVNFLDYFDVATRAALVRKARAALVPGGVLAIAAPLLHTGRTSPPDAVAYDLLLLALSRSGRPSTGRDLERLLRTASFSRITRTATPSMVMARKTDKA